MRFASFEWKGKKLWGIVDAENQLVCPAERLFEGAYPSTLLEFLAISHGDLSKIKIPEDKGSWIKFQEVKFFAPFPKPVRNVFCVGRNYQDHVRELSKKDLEIKHPQFFTKATTAVTGPYDDVYIHPEVTSQVDYEAELAVVIGKPGRNIPEDRVYEYIFGYTIINDLTARDLQKNHEQWFKGKSLDSFCPMGPWIVTKDEIGWPVELDIKSFVNGELRQNSNTKHMIFSISKLISILSQGMTLLPGDVIATGTPAGVGAGFTPPKFLKSGDVVRIEIEKIGFIENKMVG
ncbi:fumarylacetoacetate hydrolase family protein [Pseudothermotoga thermarum]|uniref:Ureidoglycolate lyase n=1 Tax=Pseudothermotoga thermarum DSM 5069 TaxID=688269 RepID=F7YUR5_9THEM|nr:fumarylacetoacetate hydrolase family protein [Pseudothermotoga thermarum]AEH50251.1 Ureidoglycolate lyase [Pseudothermotoga thermarum DSM 5069]